MAEFICNYRGSVTFFTGSLVSTFFSAGGEGIPKVFNSFFFSSDVLFTLAVCFATTVLYSD